MNNQEQTPQSKKKWLDPKLIPLENLVTQSNINMGGDLTASDS